MATYLILNLIVLLVVYLLLRLTSCPLHRHIFIALAGLFVLTFVFDNIMIALGLFTYAPDKILGVYVWLAPVEDFMYPLLAALLVPAIWEKLGEKYAR